MWSWQVQNLQDGPEAGDPGGVDAVPEVPLETEFPLPLGASVFSLETDGTRPTRIAGGVRHDSVLTDFSVNHI